MGYTITFIYPWLLSLINGGDFLQSLDIALAIGISGFSAIMLATSVYSYAKTKVSKLLPICLAFLLFMIKGLYFVYEVIIEYSRRGQEIVEGEILGCLWRVKRTRRTSIL
jgi:hypothetical protein